MINNDNEILIYKKIIYKILCINLLFLLFRIFHFIGFFSFFISGLYFIIKEYQFIKTCIYLSYIWTIILLIILLFCIYFVCK